MAADKSGTKKSKKRKAQQNPQDEEPEPEQNEQLSEKKAEKAEKGLPRKWKSKFNAEDDIRKDLERRNSTKYRMLKFFEMQKVERKLNTCRRLLLEAKQENRAEDVDALKSKLKAHLADHEYITHYPKHLPYNALFPKEDSEASKRRREEVRKLIQVELGKKQETVGDAGKNEEVVDAEPLRKEDVAKETPKASSKKAKQSDAKLLKAEQSDAKPAKDNAVDKSKSTKSKNAKSREKRRLKRNANNVESTNTPSTVDGKKKQADDAGPGLEKSSKKKLKQAASLEENGSEKASRKGDREAKKRKKDVTSENAAVDDTLHPSWHGKKSSKVSGALVGSTGKRQTFESDEE